MSSGVQPVDAGVELGQVLLGKYRVDSIIGHGGMGVVVECTHLQLGGRYAIKLLRKDALIDRDAVERFDREAKAASRLKSEYVAKVTDVGMDQDVPVMVMEFLEGHNLGELLEQRGRLPVPWASELILQTAEALAEAHSIGIVHRDVKPTNLFVTWRPDGSAIVKVLDFGISKSSMGTDMNLTQTQSLLGTPAYMSPEQMRSARLVDWRSDIWSLGSVFYELLEGRRPFEAESFSEMCVKVAVDQPSPMEHTPPELQPVILRCLAKAPEHRYATMADLGRDLIPFVPDPHQATRLVERMMRMLRRSQGWDESSASDISARVANGLSSPSLPMVPVPTPGPKSAPVAALSTSAAIEAVKPKRKLLPIVVGIGAVLGGAMAAIVLLSKGHDDKPAAPSATGSAQVVAKPAEPAAAPPAPAKPPEQPAPAPAPPAPAEAKALTKVDSTPILVEPVRPPSKRPAPKKLAPANPPVKEVPAVKPPEPVPQKPCDPFADAHGCK